MNNFAKPVKKLLAEDGWQFKRQGRGDHELWENARTGRVVVIDNTIKSRHTANGILKQAGLPKAF